MRKLLVLTRRCATLLSACIFCLAFKGLAQSDSLHAPVYGQKERLADRDKSPAEIENELVAIANNILRHDSTAYKFELNAYFMDRMEALLERPESYGHAFDKLITISRLRPQDDAFRIFSWTLGDWDASRVKRYSYYFGFIQYKKNAGEKNERIVVKRLQDKRDRRPEIEYTTLAPDSWLGALYYKPKHYDYGVLSYKAKYKRVDGLTGKTKRKKMTYYILLGFNQHDYRTNYKIIDILFFTPDDSQDVKFGAPVFYGQNDRIAYRRIFEYSDNSPFTLNLGEISWGKTLGLFPRRRPAIIFDHLAVNSTDEAERRRKLERGTQGTFDAYVFFNRWYRNRKGIFYFMRDAPVRTPGLEKYRIEDISNPNKPNPALKKKRRRTQPKDDAISGG